MMSTHALCRNGFFFASILSPLPVTSVESWCISFAWTQSSAPAGKDWLRNMLMIWRNRPNPMSRSQSWDWTVQWFLATSFGLGSAMGNILGRSLIYTRDPTEPDFSLRALSAPLKTCRHTLVVIDGGQFRGIFDDQCFEEVGWLALSRPWVLVSWRFENALQAAQDMV